MRRLRKSVGKGGFTLVEAVVAIMIFAIAVAGICKLVMISRESSDRARSHYTAVSIAKNRIERMRVAAFDALPSFVESGVVVDYAGSAVANGDYQRTTSVSNVTSALKLATVTVGIRNRVTRRFDGVEETLITYLADMSTGP